MTAVEKSGIFNIGGDMPAHRMGFGAMQLVGKRAFGVRLQREEYQAVLRRVIELGVDFIDTADAYGPFLNEEQIAETLRPYPKQLVIGTKGATVRFYDRNKVMINTSPGYIRQALEGSLRRLKLECIDLYQIHRLDGETPIEETIGVLADMRKEGKLRHIGLSEVGVEAIERARSVAPIATVQNLYNVVERRHEDVLRHCQTHGIGFIPWYPLGSGRLMTPDNPLKTISARLGVTEAQVALAWLLARSPCILLIPGTGSVKHLEENVAACEVTLSAADMAALDTLEQQDHMPS